MTTEVHFTINSSEHSLWFRADYSTRAIPAPNSAIHARRLTLNKNSKFEASSRRRNYLLGNNFFRKLQSQTWFRESWLRFLGLQKQEYREFGMFYKLIHEPRARNNDFYSSTNTR